MCAFVEYMCLYNLAEKVKVVVDIWDTLYTQINTQH